jgi:LacI family transcriptional regulator
LKIRIKDIARLAEVSPGTVDRVIHHRGEVSEDTRKRVERIIEDLDYKPDILARVLASKKSYLFSVIMPVSANDSDFWHAPNKGIDKAMEEIYPFGVNIKRYLFDQFERESFLEQADELLADKPDAVLFAPVFPAESVRFIRKCKDQNIPVVLINSNMDEFPDIKYIGQNAMKSGYLGARLLTYGIDDGDILIVNLAGHKDNHNHIIRRERGFRMFFTEKEAGNFNIHSVVLSHPSDTKLHKKLMQSLDRHRIKGIFVTNSRVFRVASFLETFELNNIRLIGYDLLTENIRFLQNGYIDFLISQKPEEQGYRGVMTLFGEILLQREMEKIQYIPIDIITRDNIEFYEYR